jgi:hypothetical protein
VEEKSLLTINGGVCINSVTTSISETFYKNFSLLLILAFGKRNEFYSGIARSSGDCTLYSLHCSLFLVSVDTCAKFQANWCIRSRYIRQHMYTRPEFKVTYKIIESCSWSAVKCCGKKTYGGLETQLCTFLTSLLNGGERSASSPGRLILEERTPVHIAYWSD